MPEYESREDRKNKSNEDQRAQRATSISDAQYRMAEKYGYVESRGFNEKQENPRGIRRGDLVPYNHVTSPLSKEDIQTLLDKGVEVGKIGD